MNSLDSIHPDLLIAKNRAYEPAGLLPVNPVRENESREYAAAEFSMNERRIKFRSAKITPTKTGLFVTLWKRIGSGPIMPFDIEDPIDFFVISVRKGDRLGQFVFPKDALLKEGALSQSGKGGKRAIRVYPTWDTTDSKQAQKTAAWQSVYFFEIPPFEQPDLNKIRQLFHLSPVK